jgi:hypothetical protein
MRALTAWRSSGCLMSIASMAVLSLTTCGGDDEDGECQPEYELDDNGENLASDEAYFVMVSAAEKVTIDDELASAFVVPADGASFAADEPPTLEWTEPGVNGQRRYHGPITTDDVYLVEIGGVKNVECPVQFFTTELTWPISDETWAVITAGGGTRTATVTNAYVTENVIHEDDGPFRASESPSFEIEVVP